MTRLHRYLARLQDTILSRQEVETKAIEIFDRSDKIGQTSEFYARLGFYDGSELQVMEKLMIERYILVKPRYVYHYQQADGSLVFRYDNAPHHPEIETYPHHKHIGAQVVAALPPDLSEVLREIDGILYPQR
ncbi:MAG TPA: hypothetical protein ENK24_04125 [Anaerolineae bacterium]|nr:hypothetical protein [Anaerolineae bacterium]